CEPRAVLAQYQQAKTGSLFAAATLAGATAAGVAEAAPWALVGERIGEAYQIADDILDATANAAEIGKPVGRDEALGRPSAVAQLGLQGAVALVRRLDADAAAAVPDCPGADALREVLRAQADALLPRSLRQAA
ncbi:MAG: polyprenyl synthetase family protein, partial [Pseudomonadota bacterium]